jgi:hypothetical protein
MVLCITLRHWNYIPSAVCKTPYLIYRFKFFMQTFTKKKQKQEEGAGPNWAEQELP